MTDNIDKDALLALLSRDAVKAFCEIKGAEILFIAWRNHMIGQGRDVPEERLNWATLPDQDKELDRLIAEEILLYFATFVILRSVKRFETLDGEPWPLNG